MMNKKGSTFNGWVIGIGLVALFLMMVNIIYGDMNTKYNVNYDSSFGTGIQSQANDVYSNLSSYQQKIQIATQNGSASFSTLGFLTLTSTWSLLQTSLGLVSSVVTGQWILQGVALMKLPVGLGLFLQLLYLITLGYIILKIIFRINI